MPLITELFSISIEEKKYHSTNFRQSTYGGNYTLYPLPLLDDLLTSLHEDFILSKRSGLEVDEHYTVRYLIGMDKTLWFAKEGCPSRDIPAHFQMTGELSSIARCLAAGNIVFSKDFKTIQKINHKSGDFHPEFDSMQWLLMILFKADAIPSFFDSTFLIEKLNTSGGVEDTFSLDTSDVSAWVKSKRKELLDTLPNQPTLSKTVSYESARRDSDLPSPVLQMVSTRRAVRTIAFDEDSGPSLFAKPARIKRLPPSLIDNDDEENVTPIASLTAGLSSLV